MVKEKTVVLTTEFYKIVSDMVYRDEMEKLLSRDWKVFTKYKRRFTKIQKSNNHDTPDEHTEDQRELIGVFSFAGEPVNGRIQINYEAKCELKPSSFAAIVKIFCDWIFSQPDIYSVVINVNDEFLKEKLPEIDFKNEDGIYILRKESEFYLISFTIIGLILGMSLGGCFQTSGLITGTIIGAVTGFLTGTGKDKREKTHRQLVEKENYIEE